MNTSLRNLILIRAVPVLLGIALAAGLTWPRTVGSATAVKKSVKGPVQAWTKVSVELPASQTPFPPGNGAVIANAHCLTCHSAAMVLSQPPLTQDEWIGEINKMRNAYGAPLPADQVQALAAYLRSINAQPPDGSSPGDDQSD